MKVKYAIVLAGLAVAFAAVSVWVFLSGGRNAKAVRAKFRLGGLMLSISSMLSVASCNGGPLTTTCYDQPAPQYVHFTKENMAEIKVGDVIEFRIEDLDCESFSYILSDKDGRTLQGGKLTMNGDMTSVAIESTDYRGLVILEITAVHSDGNNQFIGGINFILK